MTKREIKPLTGLRFLAAFWVLAFHTAKLPPGILKDVVCVGYLGVPLFFVLSGFVLTYNYCDRPVDLKSFLGARFARIYPMLFAATVLGTVAALTSTRMSHLSIAAQVVATLTLLIAWAPWPGLNSPSWSVSNEAFFYVLFKPLSGWIYRQKPAHLALMGGGIALLAVLFPYLAFVADARFFGMRGSTPRLITTSPIIRLPLFIGGIWLMRSLAIWEEAVRFISRGPLVVATLLGTIALDVWLFGPPAEVLSYSRQSVESGLSLVPMGLVILHLTVQENTVTRLLSTRPMSILGEASYSIYLLHFPLWQIAERLAIPFTLKWTIYLVTVILLSVAAFHFIETPCRRWLKGRMSSRL